MNYKELLHTGTVISCRIEGNFIDHAIIYRNGDQIWICQDKLSGADDAEKTFGKKYSWMSTVIDPNEDGVTDIIIEKYTKDKSKGPDTVKITYSVGGIDYTENAIDSHSIKDIQHDISDFDKDIKKGLENIKSLRAAKAEKVKILNNHAKFAARGWTLKKGI